MIDARPATLGRLFNRLRCNLTWRSQLCTILACLVMALVPWAVPARAAEKPNVLLIVIDDLNDFVEGFGGHPQVQSPNLARFGDTAIRFQRAYANNPVCAPSRSSMLTGLYNHTAANLFWDKWHENAIQANSHTLMSYFRENGYHTAGTGKIMHFLREEEWSEFENRVDYGPFAWDGHERVAHPDVPLPFGEIGPVDGSFAPLDAVPYTEREGGGWVIGGWREARPLAYRGPEDRDATPDEANANWAAAFFHDYQESGNDKPFFLAVGFIRPHTPLHVPQRFFDLYPIDDLQLPAIKSDDAEDTHYLDVFGEEKKGPRYYRTIVQSFGSAESGLKHFLQAYLAGISAVDENVGTVMDALDASPFRENTIVVVVSDHGFAIGPKDYLFKGAAWETSMRVPLMIRAPGHGKPGADVFQPVSLIDLYPTLVELAGLSGDTRKSDLGRPLDGVSVVPLMDSPSGNTWEGPDAALGMVYAGDAFKDALDQQNWTLRTRRFRYIRYRNCAEELYDHDTDPYEWENLADVPSFHEVVGMFRTRLRERLPAAYLPQSLR